jgi:transcriptional regulator with XRE-family HTH domain
MSTTINERVKMVIDHFCQGNQRKFADKTGISQSTLSSITGTRGTEPSFITLNKILKTFPVEPNWLMKDEGEMMLTEPKLAGKAADGGNFGSDMLEFFKKQLEEKDFIIRTLADQLKSVKDEVYSSTALEAA